MMKTTHNPLSQPAGKPTPSTPLFKLPTYPKSEASRREILKKLFTAGSLAFGSAVMPSSLFASGSSAVKKEKIYKIDIVNGPIPTPDQFVGPFYPVNKPTDGGEDMTQLPGRDKAQGDVIYVTGKIVNIHGEPCPNVKMEIWQSNAAGRYTHKNDHNPAALDPNFDGYANIVTDAEGRYGFKTVKPGAYPVTPDFWRPPHIHFELTGRVDRLVTQMYFPDEPLNEKDPILQVAWANHSLIAKNAGAVASKADVKTMIWDVTLIEG